MQFLTSWVHQLNVLRKHTPIGDAARGRRLAGQAHALVRSNPGGDGGEVVEEGSWVVSIADCGLQGSSDVISQVGVSKYRVLSTGYWVLKANR